ncbi:MAG: hypothetical protein ACO1OG_09770 [Devosia sp.]
MYRVGEKDSVVPLDDFPKMDFGAPLPEVHATGHWVEVSYHVADDFDAPRARVRFSGMMAHYLGWPNEEVYMAHPLYGRGLLPGSAYEVLNSSWREELMIRNRAHRYHRDEHFAAYRHFVIFFHDETFECLAREYAIQPEALS